MPHWQHALSRTPERMRILLTADPMIPVPPVGYGGIERVVDALLRQFRAMGHEVGLVARAGSLAQAERVFAWPETEIAGMRPNFRNALALRKFVREFKPHVVHSFSRLAYLLPILPTRTPVVMSYQRHTGGRQTSLAARVGGRSLLFTGCSDFICRMGRPHGGTWLPIPNFVEPDKFSFASRVSRDAPLVFLSRLEEIKGPDAAIRIAKSAGRRLILAGNRVETGPQRAYFDREIQPHLGRDGIEWIGEVNDSQKNAVLQQAAALLVPIRWDEPFGIVFTEALACGVPVITSRRGATPEIVRDGVTGFLVDSEAEAIAAISRIPLLDRRACREDVELRFSAIIVARQYIDAYLSHLGR